MAVHVIDDSGSTVVSDESVESHSGAFVTASRSSRSCCNSTSPTRGIDVSVGTSVDSVDASVESVDEATVDEVDELEEVDEATVDEVDEATVDEVDEATVDEVDEATVDEVEVLVDVVVAGCVVVVVDPPDAERTQNDCCPINARFALPPLLEGEASSRVGVVASSSFFLASSIAASFCS